jgi:hypothetical protein
MKPIIVSLAVLAAPHAGHTISLRREVDALRPLYAGTASFNAPQPLPGYDASHDRRVQALLRTARSVRVGNGSVGLMLDFQW